MARSAGATSRSYRRRAASMNAGASAAFRIGVALDEATKRRHLFAQCRFADRDGVDSQILVVDGGRPPDDEETRGVGSDLIGEQDGARVEGLLHLCQVERLRVLQCGKARRRGTNSFDELASLFAQFALTSAQPIDLLSVLPGIEFRERVLQPVVLFAQVPRGLLQLRRQVAVEHEIPLGEHHAEEHGRAIAPGRRTRGRLPERHQHVDVLDVDGATLPGICGADLVGAAETLALRFDRVERRAKLAAAPARSPRLRASRPIRRKMNAWVALVRRDLAGDGHGAGGQSFGLGGIRPPFGQRRRVGRARSPSRVRPERFARATREPSQSAREQRPGLRDPWPHSRGC